MMANTAFWLVLALMFVGLGLALDRYHLKKIQETYDFRIFLVEEASAIKSYRLAQAKGLSDLDAYKIFYKEFMDAYEPLKNNPRVKEYTMETKAKIEQELQQLLEDKGGKVKNSFLKG